MRLETCSLHAFVTAWLIHHWLRLATFVVLAISAEVILRPGLMVSPVCPLCLPHHFDDARFSSDHASSLKLVKEPNPPALELLGTARNGI